MTWRERAASWLMRMDASGNYPAGTSIAPTEWLVNYIGGSKNGRTAAGMLVDENTAEGIPAIYSTVHVISETVGQLPLKLYRVNGAGKKPDPSHPLYVVLHDLANPEMSAFQFREMLTRHLAIWGRAYALIQRDPRGNVVALWPLHPARMFVRRDGLNRKVFKYYMGEGDFKEYINDPQKPDIFHLHINCDDGVDGRSPLQINRESLGITLAAEQYVGAWFGNGAIPGILLTHPGRLKEGAKENLRRQWLEKFMGAKKANKLAILEEGITATVVDNNPEKSQLDKLRTMQIDAAARIYRVPLFMIQNHTKDTSWGSGIEHMMLGFVNITMMPWFQQWTQAIARDLLTVKSFQTHQAIFIVNSLVRGDLQTRVEAYSSARQNGWLNGDEIRELEDLNPIDGGAGKVFWQPANMNSIVDGMPVAATPDPTVPTEPSAQAPEPKAVM